MEYDNLVLLIKELNPLFTAFVTLIAALGGVWITQSRISKRERYEYICTRLERVYLLCQDLYEGHRHQIKNVRFHLRKRVNKNGSRHEIIQVTI